MDPTAIASGVQGGAGFRLESTYGITQIVASNSAIHVWMQHRLIVVALVTEKFFQSTFAKCGFGGLQVSTMLVNSGSTNNWSEPSAVEKSGAANAVPDVANPRSRVEMKIVALIEHPHVAGTRTRENGWLE